MICPHCKAETPFRKKTCDICAANLVPYKKIISYSNLYYNSGLEKANVRDLSGAILSLKKSLEFNKYNIDSRNLLGLIYYEMGDYTLAFKEWVISQNYKQEDNLANYYIKMVQDNPAKQDAIFNVVKKYNSSLAYAKNGDEDLAIIQLKKLVNNNPEYIKAGLLLALLYIHTDRKDNRVKAYKVLRNILKRDVANTTALKYMSLLDDIKVSEKSKKVKVNKAGDKAATEKRKLIADDYSQVTIKPYKEEKPAVLTFVQIFGGVILGILIMGLLIQPAINRHKNDTANQKFKEYSKDLAASDSNVNTLQDENEQLEKENKELSKKVEELQGGDPTDIANYKEMYETILAALNSYNDKNYVDAAKKVMAIDEKKLDSKAAATIFKKIKKDSYPKASEDYFIKGRDCYNGDGDYAGKQDFDEAIKLLNRALKFNKDNADAIYFLGRCYQQKQDTEKAQEYYNTIIEKYPDSERVSEAERRLREMGVG
ncbi:MAG: tetratricopeptide repeat protein [Lachnospiraceae bacterium]|nr:tetratricopeptide repeat protein [Lachnospiraceae bacterium]